MIKPEQVPDAVVKRFATWQFPKCTDNLMRSMLADALNAWPGIDVHGVYYPWIILPLTQENSDERPRRTLDEMRGVFAEAYKNNREPRDD